MIEFKDINFEKKATQDKSITLYTAHLKLEKGRLVSCFYFTMVWRGIVLKEPKYCLWDEQTTIAWRDMTKEDFVELINVLNSKEVEEFIEKIKQKA